MNRDLKTWSGVLLLFFIVTCSLPDEPTGPSWDITLSQIPLFSADTVNIGKELSSENVVPVGPDSLFHIQFTNSIDFSVDSQLQAGETQSELRADLGAFQISQESFSPPAILLRDFFPELVSLDGQTMIIPAKTLPVVDRTVQFSTFSYVQIQSGSIILDYTNNLPVTLGIPWTLDFIDNTTQNVLLSSPLPEVQDGSTGQIVIDLAGVRITSDMTLRFYGESNGSRGNEKTIDMNSGFSFSITLSNIKAEEAEADLPAQSIEVQQSFGINTPTVTVRSGQVLDGSFIFNIQNMLPISLTAVVTMNEMRKNGDPLSLSFALEPSETLLDDIDLSGYTFDIPGEDLSVLIRLDIEPSGEKQVIRNTDHLLVNIEGTTIRFNFVTADVNFSQTFPTISEEIMEDPPEQFSNIAFNEGTFTLTFKQFPFDAMTDINITASKDGKTRTLPVQAPIQRNTNSSIVMDKNGVNSVLPPDGTTILDILNLLPQRLDVSGSLQIVSDNVTFARGDKYVVDYDLDLPLDIQIGASVFEEIQVLDLDTDMRDAIRDNFTFAAIEGEIENNSPISGTLTLLVGEDSSQTNNVLLEVSIPEANIDANGDIQEPGVSLFDPVEIGQTELDFLQAANYIRIRVTLDSRPRAKFLSTNYIIIRNVFLTVQGIIDLE